jgi:hypothetical protein
MKKIPNSRGSFSEVSVCIPDKEQFIQQLRAAVRDLSEIRRGVDRPGVILQAEGYLEQMAIMVSKMKECR